MDYKESKYFEWINKESGEFSYKGRDYFLSPLKTMDKHYYDIIAIFRWGEDAEFSGGIEFIDYM